MTRSRLRPSIGLQVGAFLLFSLAPIHAFRLVPISQDFAPSGKRASQLFRIENPDEKRIAVQISVATREMDMDGNETNVDASDSFIVYPSQLLVDPGETGTVRVKWTGDPNPASELAYRIIAEEIPLGDPEPGEEQGAGIRIVFRYVGNIYVLPRGAEPNVVLVSASAESAPDGSRRLVLVFHNQGTSHTILRNLSLRFTRRTEAAAGAPAAGDPAAGDPTAVAPPGGDPPADPPEGTTVLVLDAERLAGMAGENILAGSRRKFKLPFPSELQEGDFDVSFSYERVR